MLTEEQLDQRDDLFQVKSQQLRLQMKYATLIALVEEMLWT
jgi:hypothetical protein